MKIIIDTIPGDQHAFATKWLLEHRGHKVDMFYLSDFPAKQAISFRINNNSVNVNVCNKNEPIEINGYDRGIVRRRREPILPDELNDTDRVFALRQACVVGDAISYYMPNSGFWVNPPASKSASNNKALQLKTAVAVGLSVPETLISNNPTDAALFVAEHQRVIYKPLSPAAWVTTGGDSHLTFTTIVTHEQILAAADAIEYAPCIFQKYINKKYEVRSVFMGKTCISAIITSENNKIPVDWRVNYLSRDGLLIDKIELPSEVKEKCFHLMNQLGIVFGSFDFCVDQNDEYFFLEVNPMGQFLWLDTNSHFPMLSMFCDFIESGDVNFSGSSPLRDDYRFAEISKKAEFKIWMQESREKHLALARDPFTFQD